MVVRPSVVIADRSEAFLMYLSILLNRLEFEALPVATGAAAAKMVRAVRPNLLFLGAELIGDNPLRLLKELRADQQLSDLPIYFTSANLSESEPALNAGANGFLEKPISLDTLHLLLEKVRQAPGGMRKSPRAPFPCQVVLVWNGQRNDCQAVTLSEGGIYLRRRIPQQRGSLLNVQIPIEDGGVLDLEGEVIYTKELPEGRFTLPPGMAVRFLNPTTDKLAVLRRIIGRNLIGDILAEQEEPVIRS